MIGLIGFTAINGYPQNKSCNCNCKKKTAHHVTHHRKVISGTAMAGTKRKPLVHTTYKPKEVQNIAQNNFPAARGKCVIDSNGEIEYGSNNTYLGYYSDTHMDCDVNDVLVPRYKDLIITSSAFTNNGVLPAKYTCMGEQVSPPLNVTNIPPGTASLAIIMFDLHATAQKNTTYWLIWNLDTTGVIPENFVSDYESQNPINKQYGYQAVCPVAGTHYYHFRVYALDTKLLLGKHATKAMLEGIMRDHVLAKGELIGQYNKLMD